VPIVVINPSINIISPFFNEEKVAKESLDALKKLKKDFPEYVKDIIIVEDGSTDSTIEVIKSMNTEGEFIVLQNGQNCGVAYSILKALQCSKSDFTFLVPGDFTYSSSELGRIISLVIEKKDNFGIYLGVRSPKRAFRSYSREFAAFLSRLSFILISPGSGIIPNYGLLLLPNQYLDFVPKGIRNYGAAIGLLGTCLVFKPQIYTTIIQQVEGSEKRSAKLNLNKIIDAIISLLLVFKNRKSIRMGKSFEH
jgi:glycosyltransferase involved in cell wall biosynthesis